MSRYSVARKNCLIGIKIVNDYLSMQGKKELPSRSFGPQTLFLFLSLSMEIATVWCWIARLPWATRTRRRERSENYLRPFRLGIYCQSGSYVMASCVVSCARPMIRRGSPRNTCVAKRHGKWEYFILPATTWWNEPPRLEACRKKHSGDSTVSFYWQVFLNLWGIKSPCGYF